MGLRELGLRRAYDSGACDTDVLLDFYVPALGAAVRYDRLAGFFSSASLAVAARGIAGLIHNGGTMRLVACPQFPRSDLELLSSLGDAADFMSLAERAAMAALDVDRLADEIARDHVRALGWMLAEGRLEIRLAVPRDMDTFREGLFHQKVGLIADSFGDVITFSGSINETAAAWLENVEQFMVFRSWTEGDAELVDFSEGMFSRYWERASASVEVVPLPDAVSRKLISYAPTDIAELDLGEYERQRRARQRRPTVQLRLADWPGTLAGLCEIGTPCDPRLDSICETQFEGGLTWNQLTLVSSKQSALVHKRGILHLLAVVLFTTVQTPDHGIEQVRLACAVLAHKQDHVRSIVREIQREGSVLAEVGERELLDAHHSTSARASAGSQAFAWAARCFS